MADKIELIQGGLHIDERGTASFRKTGSSCIIGGITVEDQFSISEAKNKLSAIVHAVEKGPSVKLTRRGRPVAVLLSIKEYKALHRHRAGFLNALKEFREKNAGLWISDQDIESLRDRSPGREVDLT